MEQTWSTEMSLGRMLLAGALCLMLLSAGCKSWLDQSEVVRNQGPRLMVPVLSSIDPVDEQEREFAQAQDVRPDDLKVLQTDYVIGRNDLVSVSLYDLLNPNVETIRTARVTETGMLSLPLLPEPVKAAGLTEQQLQNAIADTYRDAQILRNAQVTVTVVERRQQTFKITGAVARPAQYAILDTDFRILDALVMSGDQTIPFVEYLYVIRKLDSERAPAKPAGDQPATKPVPPKPDEDPLAPHGALAPQGDQPVMAMTIAEPAAAEPAGNDDRIITINGEPRVLGAKTQPVVAAETGGAATPAAAAAQPAYEFGNAAGEGQDERVIRVPLQALKNGDLRYNIVVRPNDMIIVPVPTQAFYYMGGHVGAPGVYNLPLQKITLKQAIISARMLDPLAVPSKTDVIRRVGDEELYVRVNLTRIFEGLEPDIFVKGNDTILVGTDFYPPFLAAARTAFRVTYGFGFLYDRNYAPQRRWD